MTGAGTQENGGDDDRECKVCQIAGEYGLDEYLTQLEQECARPGKPGVRPLAAKFNKEVLRLALTRADERPLESEIDALYDQLQYGDPDTIAPVYQRLQRHGLDAEQLAQAMISYRTLLRHVKNCTAVEFETDSPSPETVQTRARRRIRRLERRLETVAEETLDRLTRDEHPSPSSEVVVDVSCVDEGQRRSVYDVIDQWYERQVDDRGDPG